jgi:AraC-like DNA-binding protein
MSNHRPDLSALTIEERGLRHAQPAELSADARAEIENRLRGSEVLAGQCRRLCIRPGFYLGLYDITVIEGSPEAGEVPAGLTITVLLEGAGQSWVHLPAEPAAARPLTYAGGMTYFCFSDGPVLGRTRLPPHSRFRAVELRMEPDFLAEIGLLEPLRATDAEHPLCHVALDVAWVGLLRTPERLAMLAATASRMTDIAVAGDLALEGAALDMLFIAAELIRTPPDQRSVPERELEPLREARRLILSSPAEPWTIATLARRAGIGEKRLKAGFRARFNTSVNAFLQEVRLERAYRMMTQQGASVTEAALAVGYANPSHFAEMFRRRYGLTPSAAIRAVRAP